MDIKQMLNDTVDQQNHARWTWSLYAMKDRVCFMADLLKDPKMTYKELGLKVTRHLIAEIKRYEELILTTDMGKKMKEIEDIKWVKKNEVMENRWLQ